MRLLSVIPVQTPQRHFITTPPTAAPSPCSVNVTCDSRSVYLQILSQLHCVSCNDVGEWMLRGTRVFVLFTLQSKQQVINILLIVWSRFLGCISLGFFFFFETVGSHSTLLTVGDSFVDVAVCPHTRQTKGMDCNSSFMSSHDTYKTHARQ